MLWELWVNTVTVPEQESVSLVTSKMNATAVIPESGLVQKAILMTPTPVETRLNTIQIMERSASKPWDTSWYNEKKLSPGALLKPSHFMLKNRLCQERYEDILTD